MNNSGLILDFDYAKMENLPAGGYRICLELVRASNKDFPMGDDTIEKVYTDYFKVSETAEYGFRIDYTNDIYNIASDGESYTIDFKMMMNSTLQQEEISTKDVAVKYRLLKKNKDTGEYSPYTADTENPIYPVLTYGSESVNLDGTYHSIVIGNLPAVGEELLEIPFKLSITNDMEATNYKIEAIMYINDNEEANEYMIFNVSDIN